MDLVTGSGLAELPARKWFTDHFGKQGLLLKLLNSKTKMNGGGSAKDRCLRREFALRIFQQHPITLMLIKAGMEWGTGSERGKFHVEIWFLDHLKRPVHSLIHLNLKAQMNGGNFAEGTCLRREYALQIFQLLQAKLTPSLAGWACPIGSGEISLSKAIF